MCNLFVYQETIVQNQNIPKYLTDCMNRLKTEFIKIYLSET